jgi:alkylation response protein AidB-like acyl-CoA dehydrogenase
MLGGYGYMEEYPLASFVETVVWNRWWTSEILKEILSK